MPSFDALMELANKQTTASQIAFAKENQIRQAREKVKRLEEERKEKERIRLEKERLAKQKLQDERREKQLQEERERRQAERAATADQVRKQQDQDSSNRPRISNKPNGSPRHRSTGRPSSSTPANLNIDPEEKRRLDREEKQARARARLFGESVAAHKKPKPSRTSANTSQSKSSISKGKLPIREGVPGTTSKSVSGTPTTITARQRIEQNFAASERKPLNQAKRDRRTIEEIEQDMKRSRGEASIRNPKEARIGLQFSDKRSVVPLRPAASSSTLRDVNRSPRAAHEAVSAVKRKALNPLPTPSSKRPQTFTSLPKDSKSNGNLPGSRSRAGSHSNRRQDATVSDEEEDSSETDEIISDHGEHVAPAMRDEIWKIMGKDRRQYTANPIFSDEEDDMEADIDDVLEEEGRAARLARLEDQREEERLRQHELDKKRRLMQQRRLSK